MKLWLKQDLLLTVGFQFNEKRISCAGAFFLFIVLKGPDTI